MAMLRNVFEWTCQDRDLGRRTFQIDDQPETDADEFVVTRVS